MEFELSLQSTSNHAQALIIDYAVHHRKANGTLSPKVFKWKTLSLGSGEQLTAKRRHAIRPITTRVYYHGAHQLEILVNGRSLGRVSFELIMESNQAT